MFIQPIKLLTRSLYIRISKLLDFNISYYKFNYQLQYTAQFKQQSAHMKHQQQFSHAYSSRNQSSCRLNFNMEPVTLILNGFKKHKNSNMHVEGSSEWPSYQNSWRNSYENSCRSGEVKRRMRTQCDGDWRQVDQQQQQQEEQYESECQLEDQQEEEEENIGNEMQIDEQEEENQHLVTQLHTLLKYRDINKYMSPELNQRVQRVLKAAHCRLGNRNALSQIYPQNSNSNRNPDYQKQNRGSKPYSFSYANNEPQQYQHSKQISKASNLHIQNENNNLYQQAHNSGKNSRNHEETPELWSTFNKKLKTKQFSIEKTKSNPRLDLISIQKGNKSTAAVERTGQTGKKKQRVLSYAVKMTNTDKCSQATSKQKHHQNDQSISKQKKKIKTCQNNNTLKTNDNIYRKQQKQFQNENKTKNKIVGHMLNRNNSNVKSKVNLISKQKVNIQASREKNKSKDKDKDKERVVSCGKRYGKLNSCLSTSKLKNLESSFDFNKFKYGDAGRKVCTEQTADPDALQLSDQELFSKRDNDKYSTSATLQLLRHHSQPSNSPQFLHHIHNLQQTKQQQQQTLQTLLRTLKSKISTQKSTLSHVHQQTHLLQFQLQTLQKSTASHHKTRKSFHKTLQLTWSQVKKLNKKVEEQKKQNEEVIQMLKEQKQLINMYNTVIEQIKQQLKIEIEEKDQYKKILKLCKRCENVSKIKLESRRELNQIMLGNVRDSIGKWVQ